MKSATDPIPRFSGTQNSIKDSLTSAQQVAQSYQCKSFESASTTEQMDSLWSARKQALWATLAIRPEGTQIWSTDVAVPLSRMGALIGMAASGFTGSEADTRQKHPRRGPRNLACSTASWAMSATETSTR